VNVQELARTYTAEAIETLVEALQDPKLKVQAAEALLNRAWGRPVTPVVSDDAAADHWSQHLLAARLVAAELRLERDASGLPLIEGNGSSTEPRDFIVEPALE
jgi:hypothetical protein